MITNRQRSPEKFEKPGVINEINNEINRAFSSHDRSGRLSLALVEKKRSCEMFCFTYSSSQAVFPSIAVQIER